MSWFGSAFRHFLGVLWAWKWTYLVPIATLLLPATVYALRLPDTYDATAVVQITEKISAHTRVAATTDRDMAAFSLINQTRDKILAPKNAIALLPYFDPTGDPEDQALIKKLRQRIEWNRLGDNAFSVRCTHTSGETAAGAVNALCDAFTESAKADEVMKARKVHTTAIEELRDAERVQEEAVKALSAFYEEHANRGANDLDFKRLETELSAQRNRIATLETRRAKLKTEIEELEDIKAKGPSNLEDTLNRPESALEKSLADQLSNEQTELTRARTELARLRGGNKTEKHHKVRKAVSTVEALAAAVTITQGQYDKERQSQDDRWRGRIQSEREKWFRAQDDRLAAAKRQLRGIDPQIADISAKEKEIFSTLAAAPMLQEVARPLLMRRELAHEALKNAQAGEVQALTSLRHKESAPPSLVTPYEIVERAVAPADPTGPSRMKYLILAIAAGGMIGYGLMLLKRRYEGTNVVDAKDIAALLPGALVIEVPRLEEGPLVPVRSVARDMVFGAWVAGCLGVAVLAMAAHKGLLEAPTWLAKILEKGA